MLLISNEKIKNIMVKTLNHIDPRLADHGMRVAYLMYKILAPLKIYDETQLRDICLLTLLHDAGAYRTEEIDKMLIFETIDVWSHAINGFLYQKYFSPLSELAPVVLFHHAKCDEAKSINPRFKTPAQLISLTDRADVFTLYGGKSSAFTDYINNNRGIKYFDEIADMFLSAEIDLNTIFDQIGGDAEFNDFLFNSPVTDNEFEKYKNLLTAFVDFRSTTTIGHTPAAESVAAYAASLLNQGANVTKTAAALCGICKIGLPAALFDSTPNPILDNSMKEKYVEVCRDILDGNAEEVVVNMAADRYGDFTHMTERRLVMAVSCIIASLHQNRTELISTLKNILDAEKAALASSYTDMLISVAAGAAKPVADIYQSINNEFDVLHNLVEQGEFGQVAEMAASL